jgi:hypothetical protein
MCSAALGFVANLFTTVDVNAQGAIVDLGVFYFIYMSMLAVFCTNAINIYAGTSFSLCLLRNHWCNEMDVARHFVSRFAHARQVSTDLKLGSR